MVGSGEGGIPEGFQSLLLSYTKIHANSMGFHHLVAQGEKMHTLHVKSHTLERIQSRVKFDIIVFVLFSCVCACTHVCVRVFMYTTCM